MLLILLFNALFALSVVAVMLGKDKTKLRLACKTLSVILGVIFLFLCGCAIIENANREVQEMKWFEEYDNLYSQAYYRMYSSDSGKADLIEKISKWNTKVNTYKIMKSNTWLSVFYPMDPTPYRTIPIEMVDGSVG